MTTDSVDGGLALPAAGIRSDEAPDDESRLLRAARRGDDRAFVALLAIHEPRLRGLAYRTLRNPDLVPDALQETALRAFRSLHGFRGESKLGTWLFQITFNVCRDIMRRAEYQERVSERSRWVAEEHVNDHSDVVAGDDVLARALDSLSPEHRAVVFLCVQEGYDNGAAAEILGIPYGTVGSRLSHARGVLRRCLDEMQEPVS